jgi:hypothetical protein
MRMAAGELGGHVRLERSPSGGLTVRASLPLGRDQLA